MIGRFEGMRRTIIAYAAIILAGLGTPASAQAEESAPLAALPMPVAALDWRADLDLQRWSTSTFHGDLKGVVETLSTAHGEEQTGVLLNAAELYTTHMLLFEASSVLEGIVPERPMHQQRHSALMHAVSLLQGEPVEDFGTSPLRSPARPDAGFWLSLQAIASADIALLNAQIENSFAGLGMQSRAVLRAMLPVFTEAAIETGHHAYADAALRLLKELPDLSSGPVGYFLRGRAQERRGNASSALNAYFKAAEGWDQYAVRARLALADMSLANGSRGALLAAQSVLAEGSEAWRGDRYELEVLKRLVRVYEGTENEVDALLTLGKLLARYPGQDEAKFARSAAERMLDAVYKKGKMGAYPISDWMEVHLQLLPFFRQEPAFAMQTEVFADYLLSLGATDLSAQEYRRALRIVRGIEEDQEGMKAQSVFRLNLKLAESQLRAGLAEDARITLDVMEKVPGAQNQEDHAGLSARVLAELDDRPALIKVSMKFPTARHLRELGQALAEEDRWDQSSDVFQQLWAQFPHAFTVDDASRLLIAANRAKDSDTRARIVRSFPSLTDSKSLIELAESLEAARPQLLPLRSDKATERLQKLENAFESIRNTSAYP